MEQKPPRRSRRRSSGEASFPIIPAVLAVLVVGFLIGTALSLFGNRIGSPLAYTSPPPLPSAVPRLNAIPATPPRPLPTKRPAAAPSPPRTPSPEPTVTAEPTMTPKATLKPSPLPTSAPVATAAASTAPSAAAGATVEKAADLSGVTEHAAESAKTPAKPTEAAVAAAPPADYSDSEFAQLSAGVVRGYLGDIMRGDEDAAYAAFGAAPGDRGIIFTEQGIVDAKTQIVRVDARQTGTDAATVDVTLNTPKGQYFAQYFLKRSPTGAALITDHEMIKP